jgi:protein tyrosine phosphatase
MNWDKYRRNSRGWMNDPIARLHSRIYFGKAADVDIYTLNHRDITHVVNCAEDHVARGWFKECFPERYTFIGAIDSISEDITKWYPQFETVMNKFLSDPECKNIYVHCACGVNRSGFLCLIYMCLKFGMTIESAMNTILIQRPCALTNPTFQKQSVEYIKKHR